MSNEYNFGYDVANSEFILWRRGHKSPVARISFADGLALASTVCHVAAERLSSVESLPRTTP